MELGVSREAVNIRLEPARLKDLDALVEMNQSLIRDEQYDRAPPPGHLVERWRQFFDNGYRIFLIYMDRLVAGYCVVHDRQQPKYLRHFYVKEEYRRKGVGRRAFGLLLEALNVEEVDAEVMCWNAGGIAFWKALGFRERYLGLSYRGRE
jgi:ribosomal protein S18 acetylase RimI-like enzyme